MFTSSSTSEKHQIHYPSQSLQEKPEVLDVAPTPEKSSEKTEAKTLISEYATEKKQMLENSVDDLTKVLLSKIENSNVSDETKASLKQIVMNDFIEKAKSKIENAKVEINEISEQKSEQAKESAGKTEPIPPAVPPMTESSPEHISPFEKGKARYEKMSISISEAKNKTSMISKKIGSKIGNFFNKGKNVARDAVFHALASGDYLSMAKTASEKYIAEKYNATEKYSKETFSKIENKSKNAFWVMKLALQDAAFARAERKNEKASMEAVRLSQSRTDIVNRLNNLREQRAQQRGAVNV